MRRLQESVDALVALRRPATISAAVQSARHLKAECPSNRWYIKSPSNPVCGLDDPFVADATVTEVHVQPDAIAIEMNCGGTLVVLVVIIAVHKRPTSNQVE